MLIHLADAPLTVDEDGGRRIVAPGEIVDPKVVERWGDRGLAALLDVGKVRVIDTDEYEAILAQWQERFGSEAAAKTPRRKKG